MDRLPGIAADLVRRQVSAIFVQGNAAAVTTQAATSTIPVVFAVGGDPVKLGLVASFSRPGGNVTGVSFLSTATQAKRLELLRELAPNASLIGALVNPDNPNAEADTRELGEAARILGVQLLVLNARNERELDTAFATMLQQRVGALVIEGDPLFQTRIKQLATLTVRHAIPAIFQQREFPEGGGLMSYGAHISDANRIAGIYTGRILKGDKPADLPVQQSTKVELIINNTTAKALGIELPLSLLIRADAVIE
jgi:putative ABC transport system substrate-binding protein